MWNVGVGVATHACECLVMDFLCPLPPSVNENRVEDNYILIVSVYLSKWKEMYMLPD